MKFFGRTKEFPILIAQFIHEFMCYTYIYIYNFEFKVSAKFTVCRGAYCTVEGCIDKRSDEFVAVKIIDIPKMTITTGLTIQGTYSV